MRIAAAAFAILLAGCAGTAPLDPTTIPPAPPSELAFEAGSDVPVGCRFRCYEPSLAVDALGRIFVADGITADLARSDDGGATWTSVSSPPLPGPIPGFQTDVLLQVSPTGRLYYSALVMRQLPGVGGVLLEALQVAWSDDGAATWGSDAVLTPAGDPTLPVWAPDRQWLGFGEGETVFLTYNQIPTGIWIARSDDGGATWEGWTRAAALEARAGGIGQSGPPVVDADGRVLVPACLGGGAGVAAFVSEDGGATFARHDVAAGCSWFPIFQVAPGGAIVASFQDGNDARVTQSGDGGATWSEALVWGRGASTSPWPFPRADGGLDLAWFEDGGGRSTLHLARGTADAGPAEDAVVAEGIEGSSRTSANTDFAHGARLADGRLALVWAESSRGSILVAFES